MCIQTFTFNSTKKSRIAFEDANNRDQLGKLSKRGKLGNMKKIKLLGIKHRELVIDKKIVRLVLVIA